MAIRVVVRVLNPLFIYFLKTINKIVEQARNNKQRQNGRIYNHRGSVQQEELLKAT
jgi:hypothetical protein